MAGMESWGTTLILWLQSFRGPAADTFFKLITFLGEEKLYLILLPLIYWCIDKRVGLRLAVLVMASNLANQALKYTFRLPRPAEPPVRRLGSEVGPGFPSGHTQTATVAFGYLAVRIQRWPAHLAAAALVFLVALSRMYLGMHFPHDVVGGLLFGYVVLFVYVKGMPAAEGAWRSLPRAGRYALALGVPLAAFIVMGILWPGSDVASSLGTLAGFGVGAVVEGEAVRFSTAGTALQRALRFLAGFSGVAVLYFGLKTVPLEAPAWDLLRYAGVGFFGSAMAPWLFVRLGLAEVEAPAAPHVAPAGH